MAPIPTHSSARRTRRSTRPSATGATGSARPTRLSSPRSDGTGLTADDKRLDVVAAVAVGRISDALLERPQAVSKEIRRAVLPLQRKRAKEQRRAPRGHA